MSSYFNQLMAHHGILTQAQPQAQTTTQRTPSLQESDPLPLFEESLPDLFLEAPESSGPGMPAAPSDGAQMAQAAQLSVNQPITAERRPLGEQAMRPQPSDQTQPGHVSPDRAGQSKLDQPVKRQPDQPTRLPDHPVEADPVAALPANQTEPDPVAALPANQTEPGPVVALPVSPAEPHSSAFQSAFQPSPSQEIGAAVPPMERQLPLRPHHDQRTRETVGASDLPTPVELDPEALQAAVLQQVLAWVSGPPQPNLEPSLPIQVPEKSVLPPVSLAARINPTPVIDAAAPPRGQREPATPDNRSLPQQPLRLEIGTIQVTVEAPSSPKQPERTTPSRRENPFGSSHHFRRFFL